MDILTVDTELISKQIQTLSSKVNYWLFRANGGQYYDDFNAGNFIGMGKNEITVEEIKKYKGNTDALKATVHKLYPDDSRPGATAGQLQRFIYAMAIDDVVLVPSESSERYLIGHITSDVYTESDEDLLDRRRHSPYKKRRKVQWMDVIRRKDADPVLYKLVYAGHTMSNANEYRGFINRALLDTYITDGVVHSTYSVNQLTDIDMLDSSTFSYAFARIYKNIFPEEKLVSKTNVQSLGPIEIIGGIAAVIMVSGFIAFSLRSELHELHLKFFGQSLTIVKGTSKKDRLWQIEKEERKLTIKEQEAQDQHVKAVIDNIEKIQALSDSASDSMKRIDIHIPDELLKAFSSSTKKSLPENRDVASSDTNTPSNQKTNQSNDRDKDQ